jgi:Amt family ammonium transporter
LPEGGVRCHLRAGYESLAAAAVIGLIAAVVCYYAMQLKNRLCRDDALDVWGVHGAGGLLGTLLQGVCQQGQEPGGGLTACSA